MLGICQMHLPPLVRGPVCSFFAYHTQAACGGGWWKLCSGLQGRFMEPIEATPCSLPDSISQRWKLGTSSLLLSLASPEKLRHHFAGTEIEYGTLTLHLMTKGSTSQPQTTALEPHFPRRPPPQGPRSHPGYLSVWEGDTTAPLEAATG